MTLRRIGALCLTVLTLFSAFAAVPAGASVDTLKTQCSEGTLPLSLAIPAGDRMYFLPPYDEAMCINPFRRLYTLPPLSDPENVQMLSGFAEICTVCKHIPDPHCTESITPRAP